AGAAGREPAARVARRARHGALHAARRAGTRPRRRALHGAHMGGTARAQRGRTTAGDRVLPAPQRRGQALSRRTATAALAVLFATGFLTLSPMATLAPGSPAWLAASGMLSAQTTPDSARSADLVAAALELEGAGRNREAVTAWRAVLASGAV